MLATLDQSHGGSVHVAIPVSLQNIVKYTSIVVVVVDPHLHAGLEVSFHTLK